MTVTDATDRIELDEAAGAAAPAAALRAVAARIAPLWPLDRFVAVNPYLGLAEKPFVEAAELLATAGGVRTTMPAAYYLEAYEQGRFTRDDVADALATAHPRPAGDADGLLAAARALAGHEAAAARVATVADVAADVTGSDWDRLRVDRISAWAAAHLDEGQALWRTADRDVPLFLAWKHEAGIDRTPEVMGLPGFRAVVRHLPDDAVAAATEALTRLGVPAAAQELYVHALLLRVGGWAAYLARFGWERALAGEDDDHVVQFAAVLLAWELAVLECLDADGSLRAAWADAVDDLVALAADPAPRPALVELAVLQAALERGEQRRLIGTIATSDGSVGAEGASRPAAQAVFCIDVRSEVLRRNLEAADPGMETIGFAGFFGVPVEVVPVAHRHGGAQCPVLLTPGYSVAETTGDVDDLLAAAEHRRLSHHVRRAWKSFKMGAISCFSFVGPVGLIYLPKLFRDDRGLGRPVPSPASEGLTAAADAARAPSLEALSTPGGPAVTGIPAEARIDLAEGALRGMSLTDGFAPLVVITGHGATTVNNPYDTGLDCGACGGHTGEANARLAAAILNDGEVRRGLVDRGITIPADTWFLAGLHDTTTDVVTLYDTGRVPAEHHDGLARLAESLDEAGRRSRAERAPRLGIDADDPAAIDAAILRRSTDWAQVRPEWGLAGCRAFIAAPRHRTRGADLGGQAFLHSYDWHHDDGFSVLELILTAPVVVASWINLQYYASTVDNDTWGSGNKTLHNVVGRVGVLEGNGGDLRVGLPWQSVHDGVELQHEPLRLTVVVEAPRSAIDDVLAAHPGVRTLFDNGWVHLLAMDDTGTVSHRYAGDLRWTPVTA